MLLARFFDHIKGTDNTDRQRYTINMRNESYKIDFIQKDGVQRGGFFIKVNCLIIKITVVGATWYLLLLIC